MTVRLVAIALSGTMSAAQAEVRTLTQTALKYDVKVEEDGRVELRLPFPSGAHVTIFVIRESEPDAFYDLVSAAESSLDFWDNPLDDEDWNEACAGQNR